MHHEKEMSEEMWKAFQKHLIGPTGKFPDGKLTDNDEGEIAFAVGTLKGKVVINFGDTPIASVGMSPKQARDLATSLSKHASKIDGGGPTKRKNVRRRRRRK